MRLALLATLSAFALSAAQPQVDNVLVKMVPPDTTALVGAQIQALLATPIYHSLVDKQASAMFDKFAAETGFDPRRDVREILFATTPAGGVLLARGKFNPKQKDFEKATLVRHGVYNIWTQKENGLCILDATVAAAGKLPALEAALDEWTRGRHTAAQPLLTRLKLSDPATQLWAVSNGVSSLLSTGFMPGAGSGLDFGALFRGLSDTWLQANFANGLKFEAHGIAGNVKDAMSLRDALKGVIGFGRLSVPENQPDLLPVFDGMTVEQQERAIGIRIDLPQSRIDSLVALFNTRTRK